MARSVSEGDLGRVLKELTGFPLEELAQVHISAGQVISITRPHPVTGQSLVGVTNIEPDEVDDVEDAEVIEGSFGDSR